MQIYKVQGMTCGHCVRAVTTALQARDPAAEVRVDLGAGEVQVDSRLAVAEVLEVIGAEGYRASLAEEA
ncbi:heavy-metal-associated domain-containing protein [Pseudomonas cavernae]|uniref:Heavy-metal-associated domain-containing protein n=1 Tax=Pseudomonas cavernae TaxID=2320867 RepID=A0A385Z0U9_9PSED|nr:cation transporter [Pseudomonas cavernae]AYC31483.1 heavy-metal-associated domain-containing protein [Pseudomonas cavernae]